MPTRRPAFRATALLAGGAFALHELSYTLHPGDAAADAAHGYLAVAGPLIALVIAVAAGQFLGHLARARRTGESRLRPGGSRAPLWLAATAALLSVYSVQEATEGLLAGGHSGGLAALLGPRALYAMLLAVAIGAVIVLALRGADVAIALAARRRRARPRPTTLISRPRPRAADVVRRRPIALELAGRGPPHASA